MSGRAGLGTPASPSNLPHGRLFKSEKVGMKTLILMRHAKSDWSKPGQRDKDRALNERGRLAASQMGTWLQDKGYVPQAALISSAARTRETFGLMGLECETAYLDTLYLAEADEYLSAPLTAPECNCLLILGHNPGMESAMGQMAGTRMSAPTAATAVYSLPIKHWREARPKLGSLEEFETPKSLV